MRLENIKDDFPKMPEEMRKIIEREVEKQVKMERPQFNRRRKAAGRTIAASIAAVMILGTTAFAGVRAYRLRQEPVGEYGVEVKITNEDGSAKTPVEIPNVKLEVGYLPDGMVKTEEGKYSYEDNLNKGGISFLLYKMDTGDDKFEVRHEDVSLSENFTVNGYEGIYLESPQLYDADITFNERIYMAYTDVHYVMEMYAASDVEKEELMKIVEGIRLVPADGAEGGSIVSACNWSEYQNRQVLEGQFEEDASAACAVDEEKMANTHAVGESFPSDQEGLMLRVKDVQISDDISLLDPALVEEELKNETDGNGRLLPAEIQYIKEGSGDALSEVVFSRQAPQKLVYVTVEYTNTGEQEISEALFFGSLARIKQKDGQMQMHSVGESYEEPQAGDEWTMACNRGLSAYQEMYYYDVFGGERHNNYIDKIEPGETVTVHMGWIVTEEEMDSLYLSLSTSGGLEFSDSELELGYVDIRQ